VRAAYVDTSCLVAIAFGEPQGSATTDRLKQFDRLFSANLLEAELRGSFLREGVPSDQAMLSWISWVLPDRPLSREITAVLATGYLRGADLWHLACALYLAGAPRDLTFLTLDQRQEEVARKLGFPT